MHYETYIPGDTLLPFVKCYWTLESLEVGELQRQTIVPDGCMEMIFHYGDAYRQYLPNGQAVLQPKCFVIGQLTQPLEIEPTGTTGIFSVRFHPDGFLPFTTFPVKEMENKAVALESLFGKKGTAIQEQVLNALNTTERILLIEQFLSDFLTSKATIDRIVRATVATILSADVPLTIRELTQQNKISRRSLERKFSTTIGLSPKQLYKTLRLQTTLKRLLNKKFTNLTTLAYDGGYYDQTHFIKDFKEFTGHTPKAFYGGHLEMSSLFYSSE